MKIVVTTNTVDKLSEPNLKVKPHIYAYIYIYISFLKNTVKYFIQSCSAKEGVLVQVSLKDECQRHALRACIIVFIREVYNK